MMRHRLILAAAVSFGLVGCTVRPGSLVSLPPTTTDTTVSSAGQTMADDQAPVSEYGTLQLTVRWPERPTGYQTALLPTSTNTLVIRVSSGSTEVGSTVVVRDPNASTATATMALKAANNLSVEVLAYREAISLPVPEGVTPIARGTANVNITRSRKTSAPVTMNPLIVPTITGLSTNVGLPGDTITITGTNFGTGSIPVVVYFNGVAWAATRTSETSLTVMVPPSAPTGKVVVKADGVSSDSNFVFWVPKTFTLEAEKDTWDHSGANSRIVLFGKTKQVTATTTWVNKFGESVDQYSQSPLPTWSSSAQSAGTVNENGLFTAGNSYDAAGTDVTASFGATTSAPIKLIPEGVSLTVQPMTSPTLGGKGSVFLQFDAINTFSDGVTNSAVTYSADASASVTTSGMATATDFGSNGTTRVTVASMVDPALTSATNIQLSNYSVSTLAGDGFGGHIDDQGTAARLNNPRGLGRDGSGNLYIADQNYLRKVTQGGLVSTLLSDGSNEGVCVALDGTIYVSNKNYHTIRQIKSGSVSILAGTANLNGVTDGATSSAKFNAPAGLALDGSNNLYVADYDNHRIRKIDLIANTVSTLAGSSRGFADGNGTAAKFDGPTALTVDGAGNVYVSDMNNHRIRKITPAGVVTTLAGGTQGYQDGPGAQAQFSTPTGIAVDASGNVYVADFWNHRVRKIAPNGFVTTVAGSGPVGWESDAGGFSNGIGTTASFKNPIGLVVDDTGGRVYVVENGNYSLRVLQ